MALNTSPITAVIKMPDLNLRGREIKKSFRAYIRAVQFEISEMGKDVLRNALILTGSVATGGLYKSVSSRLVANSSVEGFTREIGFKKPGSEYAFFADQGRDSGGAPPYESIARWARAKGIDSSAINNIRYHIAEYGTEGHEFMDIALPIINRRAEAILERRTRQYKA